MLLGAAPVATAVSWRKEREPWQLASPTTDRTTVLAGGCASMLRRQHSHCGRHYVEEEVFFHGCFGLQCHEDDRKRSCHREKGRGVRRWVFTRVNGLSHATDLLPPWMSQGVAAQTELCEREDDAPCLHATLMLLASVLHKRGLGRPMGWP